MTNKKSVIDTLTFLKGRSFTKIKDHWAALSVDSQVTLYLLLIDNNLVKSHIYDDWEFQITRMGYKVLKNNNILLDNGNLKGIYKALGFMQREYKWLSGIVISFCGGVLSSPIIRHYAHALIHHFIH